MHNHKTRQQYYQKHHPDTHTPHYTRRDTQHSVDSTTLSEQSTDVLLDHAVSSPPDRDLPCAPRKRRTVN